MPGGKGPATGGGGGEGFVSGNMGLIALFGGVVLVFGGIVAANQAGVFDDGGTSSGAIQSCDEVIVGQASQQYHEHARLEVYLDSDTPYDFSQPRYQTQASFVHFEGGDGRTVHVHAPRPTLGCLAETLDWSVSPTSIETDTGETYTTEDYEIELLQGGEPAERGWNTPIQQGNEFTIRVEPIQDSSTGNQTNTSE